MHQVTPEVIIGIRFAYLHDRLRMGDSWQSNKFYRRCDFPDSVTGLLSCTTIIIDKWGGSPHAPCNYPIKQNTRQTIRRFFHALGSYSRSEFLWSSSIGKISPILCTCEMKIHLLLYSEAAANYFNKSTSNRPSRSTFCKWHESINPRTTIWFTFGPRDRIILCPSQRVFLWNPKKIFIYSAKVNSKSIDNFHGFRAMWVMNLPVHHHPPICIPSGDHLKLTGISMD